MYNFLRLILKRNMSNKKWRKRGVGIGDNCHIYGSIDNGHEFLVSMGNNVTLASGARILTHDGSTKKLLGYSKVGRVDIGNNVFIGAGAIVLPNVRIGNQVIIGAGSIITKSIADNSVVAGNPARVIGTYAEFTKKNKLLLETSPIYKTHYSEKTMKEKMQMKAELLNGIGFDI